MCMNCIKLNKECKGTTNPAWIACVYKKNEETNVINKYGVKVDYYIAVDFMEDDELREQLHIQLVPCTEQEFFDAYAKAYEDKYGEEWFLSKPNPA